MTNTEWMTKAACRPNRGQKPDPTWTPDTTPTAADQLAKYTTCIHCPVRRECANYAITTNASGGYYAGHYIPDGNYGDARRSTARKAQLARERIANSLHRETPPLPQGKTTSSKRAQQIRELATAGYDTATIANALGISERTVNRHTPKATPAGNQHDQIVARTRQLIDQGAGRNDIAAILGITVYAARKLIAEAAPEHTRAGRTAARRETVKQLRDAGHSAAVIAQHTGASLPTILTDLKALYPDGRDPGSAKQRKSNARRSQALYLAETGLTPDDIAHKLGIDRRAIHRYLETA